MPRHYTYICIYLMYFQKMHTHVSHRCNSITKNFEIKNKNHIRHFIKYKNQPNQYIITKHKKKKT